MLDVLIAEQQRNPASDIWSLGCVFLEMGTVLHDRSVQDMKAFYLSHGQCTPFVRNNESATIQWVAELQKNTESEHDRQPLELALWMTQILPLDRPTAPQVVTAVFNFEGGRPYYCDDCDSSSYTTQVEYPETSAKELQIDRFNGRQSPLHLDNQAEQVLESEFHTDNSTDGRLSEEQTIRATFQESTDECKGSQSISPVPSQMQYNDPESKPSPLSTGTRVDDVGTFDYDGDVERPGDTPHQSHEADIAPSLMSNHPLEQKAEASRTDSSLPVEGEPAQALNKLAAARESPQDIRTFSNEFQCAAPTGHTSPSPSPPLSMPSQIAGHPSPPPLTRAPDEVSAKPVPAQRRSLSPLVNLAFTPSTALHECQRPSTPLLDLPSATRPSQQPLVSRRKCFDKYAFSCFAPPPALTCDRAELSALTCQWPHCSIRPPLVCFFDGKEALESHYRSAHETHDFSLSRLLPEAPMAPSGKLQGPPSETREVGAKRDKSIQADSHAPYSDLPPEGLAFVLLPHEGGFLPSIATRSYTPPDDEQAMRDTPCGSQRDGIKDALPPPAPNLSPKIFQFNIHSTQNAPAPIDTPKPNRYKPQQEQDSEPLRFSMLPGDRRPEPVAPIIDEDIVDEEFNNPQAFIVPEPLSAPQGGKSSERPKSSLVPSYILAGTNRFARSEIDPFLHPVRSPYYFSQVSQPLFVYGSFMFPSILRNRAEQFTAPEGVYSEFHQRRLRTDSSDWDRVDLSLQHAAEKMTPAILSGYERWKPKDFSCAAIQRIPPRYYGPAETSYGEVKGFLIFGLSEEAYKCCDELLISVEMLEDEYRQRGRKRGSAKDSSRGRSPTRDRRPEAVFRREDVPVTIVLKNGKPVDLNAVSYVWNGAPRGTQKDWDINAFVKSRTFRRLSGGGGEGSGWMKEEKRLAATMKMTFVLPGDCLSDAISRNSVDDVIELLDKGEDVDAPCQGYGRPLQASVAKGNEEIVHLLLSYGPDVNATGGMYGNALICATVLGHEEIARTLIEAGANVLMGSAQYISPAYQAISHDDQDMLHLLLEHGAWLSRGYSELLDLATERNNKEIIGLIRDYDVRDVYVKRKKALTEDSFSDTDSEDSSRGARGTVQRQTTGDKQVALKPGKVLRAVGIQALMMKGTPGKWTGVKGVRVMKAAIAAGVSPDLVDRIAPHLSDISRLIDFLRTAIYELGDPKVQAKRFGGRIGGRHDDQDSTIIELPFRDRGSVGRHCGSQSCLENKTNAIDQVNPRRESPPRPRAPPQAVHGVPGRPQKQVCPTCDGRGGRRGTGWTCPECNGQGRCHQAEIQCSSNSTRCRVCNGVGLMFAKRDRCRDCGGARFFFMRVSAPTPSSGAGSSYPNTPPPPYTSQDELRQQEVT